MKRVLMIFSFAAVLAVAGFFYVSYQASSSHGMVTTPVTIRIEKGENVVDIGTKLQDAGVISWRGYFIYYVWKEGLRHDLVAGEYRLSGRLTIPEIVETITKGVVVPQGVTVVFPEGWDSGKMADRLDANGLPGRAFLGLVKHPEPRWREEFWFLKDLPPGASLEGFLFPDTYTFTFETSAETIVKRMLTNFNSRISDLMRSDASKRGKNFFDIVTLASIVENEVRSGTDRKLVADIFWRRLSVGMPLQSDATVQYVLGEDKVQHSFDETRVDSPYNTYVNKGLPPGPISNPGLESLAATLYPTVNPYYYFLSDTTTGETVFSVTFDEHKINKEKHGL